MSEMMDEAIKRWTARRKSARVLEIIQGKTTVAAASRQFDLTPAEIERVLPRNYGRFGKACGFARPDSPKTTEAPYGGHPTCWPCDRSRSLGSGSHRQWAG